MSKHDWGLTLSSKRKGLKWTHYHRTLPNSDFSITFHVFTFPFNSNTASSPTTKFIRNLGFAHWQIKHSRKFTFQIKPPLFYQWRRQTWYECHLSFFRVILLNVLPEIPKLFLQQLTSLACFELKQYFILFFKNFPNFHFPPLGYLHIKQKITLATKKGNVV